MLKIKEILDAEILEINDSIEFKTDVNSYELLCSVCGKPIVVDRKTLEKFKKALEDDFDSQFWGTKRGQN